MEVVKNFSVVTLCGSTRFKAEFAEVAKRLTLAGNVVLMPICYEHADGLVYSDQNIKKMLTKMHAQMIDMADAIFVIDPGNYIGESTKEEIEYAIRNNKKIIYYSAIFDQNDVDKMYKSGKSPTEGGCWFCSNTKNETENLLFSFEFDTYVHASCVLEKEKEGNGEAEIIAKELNLPDIKADVKHECHCCRRKEDCTEDEKDYGTQHDNNECFEDEEEDV
ncbi:MAG: hypothetical protein K0Q47_96 [Sedimentibacter sp.]|nr:hypothetical protein [Sedimentibacter sp.]